VSNPFLGSWLDILLYGYRQVQGGAANVAQRSTLNFTGAGVSVVDNPTTGATDVTIGSGATLGGDVTGAAGANTVVGLTHVTSDLTFDAVDRTISQTPSAGDSTTLEIFNGGTTNPSGASGRVYIHGASGGFVGAVGSGVTIEGGFSQDLAGGIEITGGDADGGGGTAGSVTIDAGHATTGATTGDVFIGTADANSVTIGRSGQAINISGNPFIAGTVSITSGALVWGASVTAAGLSQTIHASGAGSKMTLAPQHGHTSGTHLSGDLWIDLGPLVSSATSKVKITDGTNNFLELGVVGAAALIAPPQTTAPGAIAASLRAGRGFAGSAGAPLTIGGGAGGTTSSDMPGSTFVDLGSPVSFVSAKLSLVVSAVNVLDIWQTAAGAVQIDAGTNSLTLNGTTLALFAGTPRAQPSRAGQLTDSSGGTSGGNTVGVVTDIPTAANAVATLTARLNLLEGKISAAGTGIGVTA
jgi:hypothetical protein